MQTKKPIFETKLGQREYLYSFFRSTIILLPGSFLVYMTRNNCIIFFALIFIFILLSTFIILRGLKTFHLYEDLLIIRRPYLKKEVFEVNKIKKIVFTTTGNRSPMPIIRIISIDSQNEFSLFYNRKVLKDFSENLKRLGIENLFSNYYQ